MMCQFLLYSKVNQLYIYIHPLFFGFPSHLGHHRALSRVPCAIQQVLISYLFYTQYQQCIYVNPNLPIHPTLVSVVYICQFQSPNSSHPRFPPQYPYVCSLYLCLYFCFVNKIVYTNFFRFCSRISQLNHYKMLSHLNLFNPHPIHGPITTAYRASAPSLPPQPGPATCDALTYPSPKTPSEQVFNKQAGIY